MILKVNIQSEQPITKIIVYVSGYIDLDKVSFMHEEIDEAGNDVVEVMFDNGFSILVNSTLNDLSAAWSKSKGYNGYIHKN